ncbi:MAG: gephyrin-like molybdotransferase Glp [Candidatus Hodarchaeota archaeon]
MDSLNEGFHIFKSLITYNEAVEKILEKVDSLGVEEISLEKCFDRIVGRDLEAKMDVPPFDRAAMDGFAVIGEDTFGTSTQSPIIFKLVKEEGEKIFKMGEKLAVEVMTGAPVPQGANAVVKVEDVKRIGETIEIYRQVVPGENVSTKGEDVKKGELLVLKGKRLKAADIAILAACGYYKFQVMIRPKVAILSTGSEIVPPYITLEFGKVYDSNSYAIASLVKECGGIPVIFGVVSEEKDDIISAIVNAIETSDIIVTSGGTSVGKKDTVPEVIDEMGELLFRGVNIKPGKPTCFGLINNKPFFGLPGFPVAAMIAFEAFVTPALLKILEAKERRVWPKICATISRNVPSVLGRRDYVRVKVEYEENRGTLPYAIPVRAGGAGIISSMRVANGYIVIPENVEGIIEGNVVDVYLFNFGER